MDIQDFWEENKRWLLAVLLGVVAFFVVRSMVQFDGSDNASAVAQTKRELGRERYSQSAVSAARTEGEALQIEMERLLEAMVFEPGAEFVLRPSAGPADVQFNDAQQLLVRRLEDLAAEHGVDLERRNVQWSTPQSPDERRATLVGMGLMDAAAKRLFAAHRRVRQEDLTARGVTAIRQLRVGVARGPGTTRRPTYRSGRSRGVDASQYLRQEVLSFHIEADAATVLLWLEACRGENNPMSMLDLNMSGPKRPGDPVVVKGQLAAVTFDRERFDEDLAKADQEGDS